MHSADYAVARCMSGCHTCWYCGKTAKRILKLIPPWDSHTIRGGAGFLDLGGSILEKVWGTEVFQRRCRGTEVPQRGAGAEPLVEVWGSPQKLKIHCKLYTFEKYFVCHAWCQSEHINYRCSTQICI